MSFDAIFCMDKNGGIGKNGSLPWKVKKDMNFFTRTTQKSVVIMGRKTWESLGGRAQPLKGRLSIVVTSKDFLKGETNDVGSFRENPEDPFKFSTFDEAYDEAMKEKKPIFFIGGAKLFESVVKHRALRYLYLTVLDRDFDCDVSIASLLPLFIREEILESGTDEESGVAYEIGRYVLKKHNES